MTRAIIAATPSTVEPMVFDSTAHPSDRWNWTHDTLIDDRGVIATFDGHCQRYGACPVCAMAHLKASHTFRVVMRDKPIGRGCSRHHDEFMREWARQFVDAMNAGEPIASIRNRMEQPRARKPKVQTRVGTSKFRPAPRQKRVERTFTIETRTKRKTQ